ncbi:hypothetical protein BDZ97DRAFT_1723158 [Flammula alnicola]|nr:hypothetical protein BDZ97DRAFT_1723158 [Flammula alnicola]
MMVADKRPEEHDEDQDSLFGSPPPSPRLTGRPASPALALPSSGCSGSRPSTSTAPATQNVGTIALPGSHPYSELAINPLALSLNHGIVHRPPAQPQVAPTASITRRANVPEPSTSSQFRTATSSSSSSTKIQKKRSRQPSRSDNEPPAKPPGPEFPLPDPSAPPPVHFLRNQENLLGRAGLIAGVKPATITHTRGSTPSNPILVDEDDTPILGRRARSREQSQPYIDPSLLTAPTNQEIVSVLIGQKNIFPILEGVLKLVVGSTAIAQSRPGTGFERRTSTLQAQSSQTDATPSGSTSGQSVKKRKLNRVPAGAADWDVPYPFQQGEGPDAYHKTWERERGKQLISQLIKLIKSAARKAATKKYLQQQKAREEVRLEAEQRAWRERRLAGVDIEDPSKRINGYYRPETASYGLEEDLERQAKSQVYDVLQDASNASRILRSSGSTQDSTSQESPNTSSSSTKQTQGSTETQLSMDAAFAQLMSSLDGTVPNQEQVPGSMDQFTGFAESQQNLDFSPSTETTPGPQAGVDQPLFDTWMSFLENFPMSFDGMSNQSSDQSSAPTSHCSTPALEDLNFANMLGAGFVGGGVKAEGTSSNTLESMLSSMLNQPADGETNSMMDLDATLSSPFGDHLIDPELLALGTSGTHASTSMAQNIAMSDLSISQAASPIPSTSSFGGNEPGTPAEAGWDLSAPDVFMGGAEGGVEGQGWDGGNGMSVDSMPDFGMLPEMHKEGSNYGAAANGKGKARAVPPSSTSASTPTSAPSVPPSSAPPAPQSMLEALLSVNRWWHPLLRNHCQDNSERRTSSSGLRNGDGCCRKNWILSRKNYGKQRSSKRDWCTWLGSSTRLR